MRRTARSDPRIDVLVAHLVLDGDFSVVASVLDTFLCNLDPFFLGRIPGVFHAAASTHFVFEVSAAIIHLNPILEYLF